MLMNKKMGATKESVAFWIGMMLWVCLKLQIPFGEYDERVDGDKRGKYPKKVVTYESFLGMIARLQMELIFQNNE
ncbi:uncharacterized protein MONOS_17026 [Monocercomonoides exilis]|uniref:uncharacterized protein n=1 Tax=Monocercomonoides exilis TaxID=2049356 RepID=UPI0035599307|nr:hypothetical protein MONOS_17026 [Monocercomonoides exilis]